MTDLFDLPSDDEPEEKSKTQIKREMEALQDLGKKLMEQKPDILKKMPLSDELLRAIKESHRIKQNEAKRRHLQYIGKLMRDVDAEAIQLVIDQHEAGTRAYVQYFHQLETWRDRLIQENPTPLEAFIQVYPDADRQHLRQLIRNAQREAQQEKPPAASRKLFKYIRELADS
jgi:ribosome-associated protein